MKVFFSIKARLTLWYALLMLGVGALIYKKNNHKFLYYV